jgi:hypothetical protein
MKKILAAIIAKADEAQVNESLCEVISNVRADLGLELAPFDQRAMNQAEKQMVQACCTGTTYVLEVVPQGPTIEPRALPSRR